jgi:diaminopimelate epimerase
MRVPFVKMEGCGNDYVFVDALRAELPLDRAPELARRWSDRRFSIGGDGLIALLPSVRADVRMAMWNADGSRGAMCGNGLRCAAVLARAHGHAGSDEVTVETDAGLRTVTLLRDADGALAAAAADLGAVTVEREPLVVTAAGRTLRLRRGDAGNPHAVLLLDSDPEDFPVGEVGAALQTHAAFPAGVNVEFVQVQDGVVVQRTYERGSGETLACGSGAACAALCAVQEGLARGPEVRVRLRGGDLLVRPGHGSLVIVGPARTVFVGEIDVDFSG